MLATLSPESLSIIFAHLSKTELLSLSLVSSKISSVARLFLYKRVTLRGNKPNHQATIRLILRNSAVATTIEQLTLVSQPVASSLQLAWLPVAVLEKTTALRSLELVGLPFVSPEEQSDFSRFLRASPLREWIIRSAEGAFGPTEFPAPALEIPKLERLIWDIPGPFLSPSCLSLIASSTSTLVHLAFPKDIDDIESEALEEFCKNHEFPQLRSFEVGACIDVGPLKHLTQFLVKHKELKELKLGYKSDDEFATELEDDHMNRNMLPKLCSLQSDVRNVAKFAREGCSFLKQLKELDVGHGLNADAEDNIEEMMNSLENIGPLECLRKLSFNPGESCSGRDYLITRWIGNFAALFPGLTSWVSPNFIHSLKALHPFHHLKSALILNDALFDGEKEHQVKELAAVNMNLEEVTFVGGGRYLVQRCDNSVNVVVVPGCVPSLKC